ncbi:hypothetical protein UlMin_034052 [Ulmus minor]
MAVQAKFSSGNMGLSSICGLQDWPQNPLLLVENNIGVGLPSSPQIPFHLRPRNQNLGFDCSNGISPCSSSPNVFSEVGFLQALDSQLESQKQELECILQFQNEKLRFVLQEQRKQQLGVVLRSLEYSSSNLIRQKEEDLAQARNKERELREHLKKKEMEIQTWQRVAKAQEAMIIELNKQVLMRHSAEDAESCHYGNTEENSTLLNCKNCKARSSCVIFLPCKHLCSCKLCEAFLGSCPICNSTKEASMEVFLV